MDTVAGLMFKLNQPEPLSGANWRPVAMWTKIRDILASEFKSQRTWQSPT